MKEVIKKIFNKLGYQIGKINPYTFNYEWIKHKNIGSIIDVGANQGQFALEIAKDFSGVPIYSFEPISSVYEMLVNNTKHLNIKTYNMGLGESKEKVLINHTMYGNATSSILEMGENHINNFPEYTNTKKEEIQITTLDDFFAETDLKKNVFLKIDVQGYEDKVLLGGKNALQQISVVQMETTFVEMYKGEKLFDFHLSFMQDIGFKLMGFSTMGYDRITGQPNYADAFFVRTLPI